MTISIDSATFRRVLGHYPTGVCAITAMEDDLPVGMIVGTFTSVSLAPPLVAFFPDRKSRSWRRIQAAGRFCVNVLGADQLDICQAFASGGDDKFSAVSWTMNEYGLPILDDVIAWILCDLHAVHEAGDHDIALGHVRMLDVESSKEPLIFCKGGYGKVDWATPPSSVRPAAGA